MDIIFSFSSSTTTTSTSVSSSYSSVVLSFVPNTGSKQKGNLFFWWSLITGNGLIHAFYMLEYFARANGCPPAEVRDYFELYYVLYIYFNSKSLGLILISLPESHERFLHSTFLDLRCNWKLRIGSFGGCKGKALVRSYVRRGARYKISWDVTSCLTRSLSRNFPFHW